jgi:tetratricopeptide (TPR) repeat protein
MHEREGDFETAERLYLETLDGKRIALGEFHPDTLLTEVNLGHVAAAMETFSEARERFEAALSKCRRELGDRFWLTVNARNGLVRVYQAVGDEAAATALLADFLDAAIQASRDPDTPATELNELAWELVTHECESLRDPASAQRLAERACAMEEAAHGKRLWMYLDTLAMAQHASGDSKSAIATQRRALQQLPADVDPTSREELEAHLRLFAADVPAEF